MKRIIELTKEEVNKAFYICKNGKEVIYYFGYIDNGSGRRFLKKIIELFNINVEEYFQLPLTYEKYNKNPKFCKNCGKKLEYNKRYNKFCSSSCAASFNNRGISRKKKEKEVKLTNEEKNHIKIERWLNGENFIRGVSQVPLFIRKYLLEKNNNSCELCGWNKKNPITNKTPLSIHHKDGDCTNNLIENLQLLCPNCHSLTENFGSLNKNSKRFHRNKIAKEDA